MILNRKINEFKITLSFTQNRVFISIIYHQCQISINNEPVTDQKAYIAEYFE